MKHITRRQVLGGAAALGSAAVLSHGLSKRAHAQTPKKGGRLRVAVADSSASDIIDPHRLLSFADILRKTIIFEKLTEIDHDGKLVPQLAVSWDSNKEATEWSFELRRDVTFHNGKSMASADVVHSFRRLLDPATGSANAKLLDFIKEVREDGPSRVRFILAAPNGELPRLFTVRDATIVPAGATEFPKQAWGTGPWKLQKFEPGLTATFTRHESYWVHDRPYIDEIETIGIADENARLNALLTGEVDLIDKLNPRVVKKVNESTTAEALVTIGTAYATYPMKLDSPPFDNIDVRTALKHAFDRKRFIDLAFDGLGGIGRDNPVPLMDPDFNDQVPVPQHDPEKVKSLLTKAGHLNTVFELHSSDANHGGANAAVVLGELMRESGVTVDVKRHPADGYWKAIYMKVPWYGSSWYGQPTASGILTNGYHSKGKWNETAWKNEKFDKLVDGAKVELDDVKRREMLFEAQMILSTEGGALIPIFAPWVDGRNKRVQNFRGHSREALGGGLWEDVWLADS